MIQVSRKIEKVNEFVAHRQRINCAKIGPKSGQYVATGGDDKVVNVWSMFNNEGSRSINKPLFQLVGHSSAIKCLAFDETEESILAGSEKGSLRLWDLNSQHVNDVNSVSNCVRSFQPGHKAPVTCLDFHPFGAHFASGSGDTNVKVWDIRERNCLQTYKGHDSAITSLKFTPDGQMLVSGSANGTIKVWDLTSAREIPITADTAMYHKKAVSNIQFHPIELLLATGSEDKTVKFWEFDDRSVNFVASTELASSSVRSLEFIGLSETGEYVLPNDSNAMHLLSGTNDGIRIFSDWDKIVDDSRELSTLNSVNIGWSHLSDMKIVPGKGNSPTIFGVSMANTYNGIGYLSVWVVVASKLSERMPLSYSNRNYNLNIPAARVFVPDSDEKEPKKNNLLNESLTPDLLKEVRDGYNLSNEDFSKVEVDNSEPLPNVENSEIQPSSSGNRKSPIERTKSQDGIISRNTSGTPIGLQVDDFLVHGDVFAQSDSEVISSILSSHDKMCGVMQARLTNMKLIERLWSANAKDVREAMRLVVNQFGKHKDHAIAVDILRIVMKPDYVKKYLNLDICVTLLPLVRDLCGTRFEEYITMALYSATNLFNCFSSIIASVLKAPMTTGPCDLSAEDRRDKCENCQRAFLKIKQIAESKFTHRIDEIGTHARTYVKTLGSFGE